MLQPPGFIYRRCHILKRNCFNFERRGFFFLSFLPFFPSLLSFLLSLSQTTTTKKNFQINLPAGDEEKARKMSKNDEQSYYLKKFLFSLCFSIPAFVVTMWGSEWWDERVVETPALTREAILLFVFFILCFFIFLFLISLLNRFLLATPVQFGFGYGFYKRSYQALQHGIATMYDLLVYFYFYFCFYFPLFKTPPFLICFSKK